MTHLLPQHATDFINALIALRPPPSSIWLIGSRANGRATEHSDTDLLVFGSPALMQAVSLSLPRPEQIDCLIVHNGNEYRDPWQRKSGSLTKLKWQPINAECSKYEGVKWVPDEESSVEFGGDMGEFLHIEERAIRVWP